MDSQARRAAWARAARGGLLIALAGAAASSALACGKGESSRPSALELQRKDLAAVARALQRVAGPVAAEVSASKNAWPLVANGPPPDPSVALGAVAAAAASAMAIPKPAPFGEAQAASATGPGSGLAGLFRAYLALATRGWKLVEASIAQIAHGAPAAARFARENVALYIESVYDAHFTLAQIGKGLLAGYDKLGGPASFAGLLEPATVAHLTAIYSEAADRLHPHAGVRLGS